LNRYIYQTTNHNKAVKNIEPLALEEAFEAKSHYFDNKFKCENSCEEEV
jgi:hypothetical protein